MMTKKAQYGFTLIELMIVVAIIGILSGIALPSYQDFTMRAKLSEVLVGMSASKAVVAEFWQSEATMPIATGDVATTARGLVDSSQYVGAGNTAYSVAGTIVNLTATIQNLNADLNGQVLDYQITGTPGGGITILCDATNTATSIPAQYLPSACK